MEIKKIDIAALRNKLGVSQKKLAEMCQVHWRTVQNWEKNPNTIPATAHSFLCSLITDDTTAINTLPETRPRIPYDAAAGTITESMEGVTAYQCEQIPVIPIFPRYDFTIRIYGDSMEPEYHSGDEVACLNINTTHFIQWGRVHVLDTMQGIVIKRIYEDGDSIRCRSYNSDYPDFLIPKVEIRSFNLVVGSLRI